MKGKRSFFQTIRGFMRIELLAIVIMTVVLGLINPYYSAVGVTLLVLVIIINRDNYLTKKINYSQFLEEVAVTMDETITGSVINNPFPLCMLSSKGVILWCNDKFKNLFKDLKDTEAVTNTNIYEITGVKLHELSNEELRDRVITIAALKKSFRVQISHSAPAVSYGDGIESEELHMLHWIDLTASETLKKTYREERLCISYIQLDNMDDIISQASDEKKASLRGEIETVLRQWATRCQGALIRSSKDVFIMLCDARNADINETNKFPILDEVRAIPTGVDIPVSLTIGMGRGGKTIDQTEEFAAAALDLALGRGGDQAVVKKSSIVEYYGGKLMTVEKRNKGKSRIVALALKRLIEQSPRVFVMGHKMADMDSFGASLGVARMAKARGKEVFIVIDNYTAVDMLYKLAVEEGEYKFIKSQQAKNSIKREDLLIVVDNHKPSMSECGELTTMVDRIVIIDHHRRGEDIIKNPTLVHIEPYASSTCELVAEMLQYASTEKKALTNIEAEGLLAGIAVDTKNFSIKTGVRTFDAAAWLRRQGADTIIVRQFFQTDMEIFREKAGIITRAKQIGGDMAISYVEDPKKNLSVLIAMAADELLNIRGLKASFVIGKSEEGTLRVSARSLGDVNVQRIMEKIGGGGNLTTAGAQLDMDMDEALQLLEKTILETVDSKDTGGKK